jgi:flagellar M-ring protein FliF
MDVVNQAFAQISSLFRSMSAGGRIVAGLLLTMIVISLAFLFNQQTGRPGAYLMTEPHSAEEIQAILNAFGQAGLKNYEIEGSRVRVPRGEEATYMAAVVDAGAIPASSGSYLRKALEGSGMLSTKATQAALLKNATQMELAHVIRKLKNVRNALVLIDSKKEGALNKKEIFSASVTVETINGMQLESHQVQAIRVLVSSAVAGMSPESVAVADMPGGFTYPQTLPGELPSGQQDKFNQTKLAHERSFTEKIKSALAPMIPGVVVSCNVELNPQIEHLEHRTQHDPKTVPYATAESQRIFNSQTPQIAGRPGLGAQGGLPNQPAIANSVTGAAKSEEETSERTEKSKVSGSTQEIRLAPLAPQRVTAAIGVPSSYIEEIWQKRNPPPPGEEPRKPTPQDLKATQEAKVKEIQEWVATLIDLPKEVLPNPIPQVKVTVFDQLPTRELPQPGIGDHALAWFGSNWSTLGTGLLGILSLVMLRSVVRTVPTTEKLPEANTLAIEQPTATEATPNKAPAAPKLRRRERTGTSLREELVEIVREDPEAAASVLRTWIASST